MASLCRELFFCGARDVLGNPIASGTVLFTVLGSTSQQATVYKDAAQTQPWTQPIPLDAAGRVEVYVGSQCEMQVFDAFSVLKRTTLNGTSVAAPLVDVTFGGGDTDAQSAFTALESTIGPGGQYKQSNATGCVSRSIHNVLLDKVSPLDFGAVGDGAADDTIPLQRSINAAISANVPLYLDAKKYKITAALTVNGSIKMFGCGAYESQILSVSDSFDGIQISAPSGQLLFPFALSDFSVLLSYATGAGNAAIRVQASSGGSIERMNLSGCIGVSAGGCSNIAVRACSIAVQGSSGHTGTGIVLSDACSASNCYINCNPSSGTVQYTNGVVLGGEGGIAERCKVSGAAIGYNVVPGAHARNITVACDAIGCNTGFSFSGQNTGALGCSATSSASNDWIWSVASPTVNHGNSWSPKAYSIQVASVASPTFTFDPTSLTNVFVCNGSFSTGFVTIAWPASSSIVPGTEYTITIRVAATFSTYPSGTATVVPSQMLWEPSLADGSGRVAGPYSYSAKFVWTTGAYLQQITKWELLFTGTNAWT
jgi:hypothetical protein